jgi:N-carbamoyl-L-amino-acid hydrolase|tara:strand:- start:154 stop:1410 length:1257 start_codon:yes stop_codon:yes gene_type:complete
MDYKNYSDSSFIEKGINELAKLTEPNRPYTRLVFSNEFYQAREWLHKEYLSLGLSISTDEAGNLIGLLESKLNTDNVVIIGSHLDTVPAGGRYDGIAGVVSALNVIKYIIEKNIELPFNLAVYDYLGEELNSWGVSCIGARGIGGFLNKDILNRVDSYGRVLSQEIDKIGGNSNLLSAPLSKIKNIVACLELHIEQGKVLEKNNLEIGIVRSIPNISRHNVIIKGQAGHSGTVLMNERVDALVVASELIIYVNSIALEISMESNSHFVATVGKINVYPNSATIIPGVIDLTIDLRSVSDIAREKFLDGIKNKLIFLEKKYECELHINDLAFAPYVEMDKNINLLFKKSCNYFNLSSKLMDSGAGHDTAHLARVAPASMIFVPCKGGLSHCPEELAKLDDIAKGTAVITKLVLGLAKIN